MKHIYILFAILLFTSCVKHSPSPSGLPFRFESSIPNQQQFSIFVEDNRPLVETQKQITTNYLYSGNLFTQGAAQSTSVAQTIGNNIVRENGAKEYVIGKNNNGIQLNISLDHWYSRCPNEPNKNEIVFVEGLFSGTANLLKNNQIVSTFEFTGENKSLIDFSSTPPKTQQENENLLLKAMEGSANNTFKSGTIDLLQKISESWHLITK